MSSGPFLSTCKTQPFDTHAGLQWQFVFHYILSCHETLWNISNMRTDEHWGIDEDDVVCVSAAELVEEHSDQSIHRQSLHGKKQANTQYPNHLDSK
jgi:hypothetical protein